MKHLEGYVIFKETLASAQRGPLFWHLLFMSMDVAFLCMEYGNLQTSTSYRVLSNGWYVMYIGTS